MLKHIIFTLASFGLLRASLSAQLPDPLPEQFTVNQRWFSWTSDFDIETKEYRLGYIHRKFISWMIEYEFRDIYDQLESRAKARWLSWGAVFDVIDAMDNPLGIVEERIFTFFPTFDIISPTREILAIAKLNFWGTRYTLKDPVTDISMVTLYRPFFRWKENWTVTIENPALFNQKQIDPRLFLIVMALQSDREMWARKRRRNSKSSYSKVPFACTMQDLLDTEKLSDTKNAFNALREQLEIYRSILTSVDPSEFDLEQVEEIVETKLQSIEYPSTENEKGEERIISGLQYLMPLLDSNELTDGQKSALYMLIDYKLNK
ncbi:MULTISPECIES: hypothetical protein [Parachlamydia]|jgi:uncharacterized protein YxjI|uniref:Uncharacterized protein n=2 Tax=Parachlamydia acanthamoebae TaxID=83552 RepID=F8L0I1_PARAV|nr:hypothetical protein [Parachlamydia acanthamoebae]EFB41695.1 hypothetical protein pah_c026o148 [Parachlamydia acanthamoebae str. Hall's coccus]KIA77527.1 hypothetical protein DB43_GE00080 [Parachlamydia acanthamoebae]CCB86722.1 putative uncharacterized protein [Parachlamydia acanthamoebae UV-7]